MLGGDLNAGGGLRGQQQEADVYAAIPQDRSVIRKMLTPVTGAEAGGTLGRQRDAGRIWRVAAADREPDPVHQGRKAQGLHPLEGRFHHVPPARPGMPHGLRLDLDDVDEVTDLVPDQVQARRDDHARAEVEP